MLLLAQLGRHRAEMQQRQQMADAQPLHAVEQLLAHGLRAADDDEAAVEEILGLELAQVEAARADCWSAPAPVPDIRGSPGSADSSDGVCSSLWKKYSACARVELLRLRRRSRQRR